ncbi:MAG: 5,6-dimethylbenzimidazole synthase [bacterium]|nr:5,6-dimethylbenzimidazole synthase [bacterium]
MANNMQIIFNKDERATLYKVLAARRDMRHFIQGASVPNDVMDRLFEAAHLAPSVGLMQPWRFISIQNEQLRKDIARLVDEEISNTASEIGVRKNDFLKLKLEGIRTCAQLVAVVLAPDDGTLLGRRTLPLETALCSVACAIENMWLAARVENIGLGWVSLFDPQKLGAALHCPKDALPIALLCIGPVHEFYEKPMLVQEGWRDEKPLAGILFENRWPIEGEAK